jgi:hypothetical protein
MPKPAKPPEKESPQDSKKTAKKPKPKYEPPKLEKFEQLERLIVSGE